MLALLGHVAAATCLLLLAFFRDGLPQTSCCGGGPLSPGNCNVAWSASDSVTACPAGDSVYTRPSRLYVRIHYEDNNCNVRVGVPPDSIWVTYQTVNGNLVLNDMGTKVFADDSTNANGDTWIILRSFSGCGTIRLNLLVSGKASGVKDILVRTTDPDASGRHESIENAPTCDLNYDGVADINDVNIVRSHVDHWHRNALFGTMVRRTNYCETCPGMSANTKGESQIFWSPSGRYIAHTAFIDNSPGTPSCKVFIVPSDPAGGNALTQFTSAPLWYHDYDPSWSPLNDVITWDRGDSVIFKKQVPWSGNPAEVVVTASNNAGCGAAHGDDIPAISPDGQWVAFSRCNGNPTGGWSLWKIPIAGGAAVQLTETAAQTDFYASWSPDGQTIYFQRNDGSGGEALWRVSASGGTADPVFIPPQTPASNAAQPALSPDGRILLMGYGEEDPSTRRVITHTLDPMLSSPTPLQVVPNYPDTNFADSGLFPHFPILSPRLSPDGTRTALGSKQVYAARRNMSLPPRITSVGTQGVADTAATTAPINVINGNPNSIQVVATDTEGDTITCHAYFLRTGMVWDSTTCTLNWTPAEINGSKFYVKFVVTTKSGGSDQILAELDVVAPPQPNSALMARAPEGSDPDGPNPTHGRFALTAPPAPGQTARLDILDVSGRKVATVHGPAGSQLVWDGRDRTGRMVSPGIYLYRMEAGTFRREGAVVVLR